MGLGVNRKVHYFGERVHGRKVVLLGNGREMVRVEVAHGSNLDKVVVVLKVLAQNGHKNTVWMIGHMMDMDRRKVLGMERLVRMVEVHVEDEIHRHMVAVLGSQKVIHHSHWIGMYHRMALLHSALVEVVAMRIDHMHMAPLTFGCPIFDTFLHCNLHFLQHSCNHTHSQSENS